jgi:N-acetylmuramoyl-L-alanine amidase
MGRMQRWLFLFACFIGSVGFALPTLPVNDIQVKSVDANTTDVKFIFSGKPDLHYFILANPPRFVVDIAQGKLQIPIHNSVLANTLIQSIRQGQQPNQVLRLVFDMHSDVMVSESMADSKTIVFELKNKNSSVTTTSKTKVAAVATISQPNVGSNISAATATSDTAKTPAKTATATNTTKTTTKASTATAPKSSVSTTTTEPVVVKTLPQGMRKVVVVIDAGHGGKDPGASGPRGSHEKDVVLAIAQDLYADVNQTAGMRAVMTRSGDYYLTLRQRLQKARAAKADIFIAIHADAYQDPQSRGASVYALSLKGASSEAARWLAAKENYSELGGVNLNDKNDVLRSVLIDLSQTATISASLRLGGAVLGQLHQFTPLHHDAVEQARFVVLKSPDIPSVLVETGFLSNSTEELQLRNPQYQQKVAKAILQGAVTYFYQQPPEGTWIAAKAREDKPVG